uniref:Uncharacterized protein n=1 Tax=Dictyostelium citrinum TaxID=361072 RepID=B2VQ27_DICCI|nr:hypothetical protein [Dictyostelium citrinum]
MKTYKKLKFKQKEVKKAGFWSRVVDSSGTTITYTCTTTPDMFLWFGCAIFLLTLVPRDAIDYIAQAKDLIDLVQQGKFPSESLIKIFSQTPPKSGKYCEVHIQHQIEAIRTVMQERILSVEETKQIEEVIKIMKNEARVQHICQTRNLWKECHQLTIWHTKHDFWRHYWKYCLKGLYI